MKNKNVQYHFADGNNVFFTSDTHWCHKHIIEFCDRPFKTVEEMNKTLIDNWNSVVNEDSIVFHLGDFAWGGFQIWKPIRDQLKGHIILIKGNHDRKNIKSQDQYDQLFDFSTLEMHIEIEGRKILLNHCPLLCYAGTYRSKPSLEYQLFGHVHLSKNPKGLDTERVLNMCFPTQYDVGVDFNNFKPISWKEVNEKIQFQIEKNVNIKYWIENGN